MSDDIVGWAVLALVYFGVLVVVAWEPYGHTGRGRHRRDLGRGAR